MSAFKYFPMAFYLRYSALQKDAKHGWHQKETVALSWLWPFSPWRHSVTLGITLPIFLSCVSEIIQSIYYHLQHIKKILTDPCLAPSILKWSHSCLWCTRVIICWVWGKTRLEGFLTMCACPGEIIRTNCKINFFTGNRTSSMWDTKIVFFFFYNFDLEVLR